MLTREKLLDLFQELRGHDVLSIYVDADQRDPARRDVWRTRLEGDISRIRHSLEKGGDDGVAAFDAAWTLVERHIRTTEEVASKRGWVAFATADRIWHAGAVPAHMPALVAWQQGIRAAPYIRALKQERPVTVALVDGRRARIFEQVEGHITELKGVLADAEVGDLTDMGVRKRPARASGVRGTTSTDEAQRLLDAAGERLRKRLAEIIQGRAGNVGIVVVGGPSESARALVAQLDPHLPGRVVEWHPLHLDMTEAEVREQIRLAAGDLSEQEHLALVSEVADAARAGGKGALGQAKALEALEGMRVAALLLSRNFLQAHPDLADHAVGMAFGQGADVEELSGAAGEALDGEGGGIAARLRFLA